MKILYIHNDYAKHSGEEAAAEAIASLLQEHGHIVEWFRRSSAEISGNLNGKIKSFFCGIANPSAARELARKLDEFQPDIVQVQNIYPLLSPSIFKPIKARKIPVIMRCPNYRLFCPNGLCCDIHGRVCEKCFGGHEWHCTIKNCMGSRFKSFGYTVRGYAARLTRRILKNVDVFIVQTEFQKQKFVKQGIPEEKIGILPGIMQKMQPAQSWSLGKYVTFVGRVSPEKGIEDFLECARRLPEIPFLVAGSYDGMPEILEKSSSNVEWLGFVKGEPLRQVYLDSRMIVVPSRCYEGFPNVIVQAMQMERPVIAVNLGASGSVVREELSGRKYEPGNIADLTEKVKSLYNDIEACHQLGVKGKYEAEFLYSRDQIFAQWTRISEQAIKNNQKR